MLNTTLYRSVFLWCQCLHNGDSAEKYNSASRCVLFNKGHFIILLTVLSNNVEAYSQVHILQ